MSWQVLLACVILACPTFFKAAFPPAELRGRQPAAQGGYEVGHLMQHGVIAAKPPPRPTQGRDGAGGHDGVAAAGAYRWWDPLPLSRRIPVRAAPLVVR